MLKAEDQNRRGLFWLRNSYVFLCVQCTFIVLCGNFEMQFEEISVQQKLIMMNNLIVDMSSSLKSKPK